MKFNEIDGSQWEQLKPYFDTCLLPVTGLSGREGPAEARDILRRLRDMLELVEVPYKGRVVTYPAVQYAVDADSIYEELAEVAGNLKSAAGFRYVMVVTAMEWDGGCPPGIDLIIDRKEVERHPVAKERKLAIYQQISRVWQ